MIRLDFLLDQVRNSSGNTDVNAIKDDEIVQYFNDGQERIQSLIVQKYPRLFTKESVIALTLNEDEYDLPTDVFTPHRIRCVERTDTNSDGYYRLPRINPIERNRLHGYFLRENKLILDRESRISNSIGLRIQYVKKIPKIDIRRGQITSLSPLTVDTGTVPENTDFNVDYISIVDKDGTQNVTGIYITGYTAGTGVIATTATLTGASIGDYVVYGTYASTHSELPDVMEKYLLEYAAMRLFHRDSSVDIATQSQLLLSVENELEQLFSDDHEDVKEVVIKDFDYLVF